MPTTPTTWRDEYRINQNTAGDQSDPVITVLADGNYLVTWTDANSTIGPDAGTDIVGRIYDMNGNSVGGSFQMNVTNTGDNETNPTIAAITGGGFVVVYEVEDAGTTSIYYDRYDVSGAHFDGGTITSYSSPAVVSGPSVSVFDNGNFLVTYDYYSGTNTRMIYGTLVESDGTIGTEQIIRSDSDTFGAGSDPISVNSATLNDGSVVTVFIERDFGQYHVEYQIVNSDGSLGGTNTSVTTGASNYSDPQVSALSTGGFVIVWESNGVIGGQALTAGGSGLSLTLTMPSGTDTQTSPDVIGLSDGGFFAVWYNATLGTLEGASYTENGTLQGSIYTISDDASGPGGQITDPELGLTADGRVVVTWQNREIYTEILDTRESTIYLTGDEGYVHARLAGGTIIGSSDADDVHGESNADNIYSGGGNDTLYGAGGNDLLSGGSGDDVLTGGNGNDSFYGGSGIDTIIGGNGADMIRGGHDTDELFGGGGGDTFLIYSGEMFDNIYGGNGKDELNLTGAIVANGVYDFAAGTMSSSQFAGTFILDSIESFVDGDSDSTIYDLNGDFTINAGGGNDTVYEHAGGGKDVFRLGAGNDLLIIGTNNIGGVGSDIFNGGNGVDTIDYSNVSFSAGNNVVIDLSSGTISRNGASEAVVAFENVIGSQGSEEIIGNGADNIIDAGTGTDTVRGNNGNDTLSGGGGNDDLFGGNGADTVFGGTGSDELTGASGNDDLHGENGGDELFGGKGHDDLYGGGGNDILAGGKGHDDLYGGGGNDVFVFEDAFGDDTIYDFGPNNNKEKIDLSAVTAITGFADLNNNHMTQDGDDVLIEDGNHSIRLIDVDIADLDGIDFIF